MIYKIKTVILYNSYHKTLYMFTQSHSSLLGSEIFEFAGQPVGFYVIDFWRFQFSNIWDIQDQIAEFIVAKALGQTEPYNKNGWTLWDINYRGQRIEVKETAYYHSWRNDGKVSSQRTFSITKAYTMYKNSKTESKRQSDIYVFCLNTGETKESSNPLILDNWRFWVVPTETINRACGDHKTISLGRLRKLTSSKNGIGYNEIRSAVDGYC